MKNEILLRKLSIKSTISGLPNGYMENQPVNILLSNCPKKLIYIYYTFEKITFTDDILEQLGIKENYKISKPGCDKVKQHQFFLDKYKEMYNELSDEQRMGVHNKMVRKKKVINEHIGIKVNKKFTPNKMRIKNQGIFKQY